MLSIVLKILSILGILLLCLLGLAVFLLLCVLFFPISYKLTGKRDTGQMTASVRISWLFGLLRVSFDYPEPGRILMKVLPFTVFDSGKETGGKTKKSTGGSKEKAEKKERKQTAGANRETDAAVGQEQATAADQMQKTCAGQESEPDAFRTSSADIMQEQMAARGNDTKTSENISCDTKEEEPDNTDFYILKKVKKIKYTIRSIYDKIKNIWENISYYIKLLQEEETKLLFSHVIFRLGKVLKSIRPRNIRGQILFGTGSPDTTGYAYGVYGMLSPFLGSGLLVTPDFTRAVLEGNIHISGHITIFTILWNGLKVLLDKKLRRFIKKMKAGRKK